MKLWSKAFVFGMAVSGLALAGCAGTPAQDATASATGEPLECRYEHQTGSRVAERVCLTERQWAQLDEQRREAASSMMRRVGEQQGTAPVDTGSSGGR